MTSASASTDPLVAIITGIEHDRKVQRLQPVGQRMRGFGRSDHPDLDRVRADIGQHAVDLRHHHRGRHRVHRLHAQRILRGDGGDRGHRMAAQHRHCLDVRLYPGTPPESEPATIRMRGRGVTLIFFRHARRACGGQASARRDAPAALGAGG
jgi:hypothetical protein